MFFITIITTNGYLLPLGLCHFEKLLLKNSFSVLILSLQSGEGKLLVVDAAGSRRTQKWPDVGHTLCVCAGGGAS